MNNLFDWFAISAFVGAGFALGVSVIVALFIVVTGGGKK